ncbi:10956_t:CDS:1 [Funneliformis caledonium]|uniref:10956_t:CDS:1 n=1 Tax=Funneliformis caledonium TaxID=1117310 RepID=A0A9N9AA73_9GLOM|nr:10956_t:CDS:1 [Funneliformis caledonium]
MTFLITRQFKHLKQIISIPTTTLYFLPSTHIFLRRYTARKPTKLSNSSAPIYARRELEDGSLFISRVPLSPQKISYDDLPPPLKPIKEKSYHLTQEQVKEIQQLREQNPVKWSRKKLAEKFECSQLYIGIIAPVSKERRAQLEEEKNAEIEEMGWKKRFIRKERVRRREIW